MHNAAAYLQNISRPPTITFIFQQRDELLFLRISKYSAHCNAYLFLQNGYACSFSINITQKTCEELFIRFSAIMHFQFEREYYFRVCIVKCLKWCLFAHCRRHASREWRRREKNSVLLQNMDLIRWVLLNSL